MYFRNPTVYPVSSLTEHSHSIKKKLFWHSFKKEISFFWGSSKYERSSHVQSKWRPKGITLIWHGTCCVHTLMRLRKMKFIYIYSRREWWTVAKVLFEICIRHLGLYFVLKFYQKIFSTSCDFRLFVYKIYQWTVASSNRGANFNFSLTKTAWNQRIVFEINFENGQQTWHGRLAMSTSG